jgi:hypothetical protein
MSPNPPPTRKEDQKMLETLFGGISVHQQLVIVVPALIILGYALRRTPKIRPWMINWILIVASVGISFIKLDLTINAFINGIIAAGSAITLHQLFKESRDRKKTDTKK